MTKHFRNLAVVSLSTLGSRLLGLLRDILIFAALGTSIWNAAFLLAFTLPNLFRRLLGEGALSSAVVPVFTDVLKKEGQEAAFDFFNQVLLRVCLVLLAIVLAGVTLLMLLNHYQVLGGRWVLGADLSVVLLPYMIFICLAAIVSAGLNVVGRFAAAAITPLLLNLSMILALLAGWLLESEPRQMVYLLCAGVLLGGLAQLLLPAWDFMRQGWHPKIIPHRSECLGQVWKLFLPGLMGAGILQVNILISRLLAFSLDGTSVSTLYLASRLMELPLGVFTLAVVTVFFPLLASAASEQDEAGFARSYHQGVRLILAISIPAGLGLVVLAQPILSLLFDWGNFSHADALATVPLLIIYAIGLPFYSIATFATRGLHARRDMVSPVRVALICLGINAVAGYVLMQFFGAAGLAAANILASLVQAGLLCSRLSAGVHGIEFRPLLRPLLQVISAALGMALAVVIVNSTLPHVLSLGNTKLLSGILVGICLPLGVLTYLALLTHFRFEDLGLLKSLIFRKGKS